jgi:hypothetical protein
VVVLARALAVGTLAAAAVPHAAVLARADLGRGWAVSEAAPTRVPGLTCDRFHPETKPFKISGRAASPTFGNADSTEFVSQSVYAFANPAAAAGYWGRVARRGLLDCVAESLVRGSTSDMRFHVERRQMLSVPKVGDGISAYRVTGTESSPLQTLPVYLDLLVVRRGGAVSAISFSSVEVPVAQRFELRLARRIVRRLAGR